MTTQPPMTAPAGGSTIPPPQTPDMLLAYAKRLRAEYEAAESPQVRAILQYETAVALERAGDDAAAVREYLGANKYLRDENQEGEFREPLESMIALMYRKRSFKVLRTLLDQLVQTADGPESKGRALVERAAYLLDYEDKPSEALDSLQEAVAEHPDEVTAWLELEILAGKQKDSALRRQALAERVTRAEPATWRQLLYLDLADLEARSGELDKAAETLRAAAMLEGEGRFRVFVALAELARREDDDTLLAEALEAQGELMAEAMGDAERGDLLGIPRYVRSAVYVADVWLRAADARRRAGDMSAAARLLDQALGLCPDDSLLVAARLTLADATSDREKSAELSKRLLELGSKGPEAASLRLRTWEAAIAKGDTAAAFEELAAAVAADPTSVAVRSAYEDALTWRAAEGDSALLAASREAAAELVGSEPAKAKAFLEAAWHWAVGAKDAASAKLALSQAGALGIEPTNIARLARSMAALQGDATWVDESLRRLIASGSCTETELASVWFEVVRARLLRGDREGARKTIESLSQAPGGAWLARLLAAFVALGGEGEPGPSAETLDTLASVEPDADLAKALSLAAAWRARLSGDVDGAIERLRTITSADASDLVAVSMLAGLLQSKGDTASAAAMLQTGAAAIEDDALAGALYVEAGLNLWKSGNREGALEAFAAAQKATPLAAGPVLAFATRAARPDDADARRRALELAAESEGNETAHLERWGLEVSPVGEASDALRALEQLEQTATGELALAAALARVIWPGAADDRAAIDAALEKLEKASNAGSSLAHGERTRLARDVDGNTVEYARCAAGWAASDPSLAPALEWLSAVIGLDDRQGEAAAYRLMAEHMSGAPRGALLAQASTVEWLSDLDDRPPPVPTQDPAAVLYNLELAAPGSDPRRRALALRSLGNTLGEESMVDAFSLVGWSELAAGQPSTALAAFEKALEARPDDIALWEGVRASATVLGDPGRLSIAAARLGELSVDPSRSAEFFEQAGFIWLDSLNDAARGEQALSLAFSQDPTRFKSFDRLFRRVRERGEDDLLLEITARRIEVTEDSTELAKLYWEQARVLRKKGNYQAALDALTNVTMLEPDHVGALALSGEVYIKQGQFAEAAEALSRLAAHPDAPAQQRLISAIAAVDVYEKRLDNPKRALEILVALHEGGLATLPVRERLALVAAKTGAWKQATTALELLMTERDSSEGRVAAARLATGIWRDKVKDPVSARRSVGKLLEELPGDGEGLDLVLSTKFDDVFKQRALSAGRSALVNALQRGELKPDEIARLSQIAKATGDGPLTQAALGVLVALGRDSAAISQELNELDLRVAKMPQIQIDDRVLAAIGDPMDTGAVVRLFAELGPTIGEALGPSKDTLGVGRRERVDPRGGLPLRNDIAAWAGALGLGEFELYVGGKDPNAVYGVAGEVPAIVVGSAITSPLTPAARQAIARELFALRRGISAVHTRDETTVASIAIAACNLAEVRIDAPAFAMLGDVQRQLKSALPRAVKKKLPELCAEVARERPDLRAWAEAAQRSLDRVSAIAAGDVSLVLADVLKVKRADVKSVALSSERAKRLLRFVLSPTYLDLRKHLGMGVR
ncbi:MAG: tetratricopeptide repeat protein [Polyangiaceae bacterium]